MLLSAERVFIDGEPRAGVGVRIDKRGAITEVGSLTELGVPDLILRHRVLLPGFVNAHSHAFQRLLRGRTQVRGGDDDFWSWRAVMYGAAARLDPEGVRIASQHAFLEMLLAGVTTVGEFHYLHHQPNGRPYDDPHLLAEAVVQAALDVGIRLCLLRVVYLRGDFDKAPEPHQRRFCDPDLDTAWNRIDGLFRRLHQRGEPLLSWGAAAHSLRAVPLDAVVALKTCGGHIPIHIHVAEQKREVEGCIAAYGAPPVELLARSGVLDASTTLVHATHLAAGEAQRIAQSGAVVCVCPSTEADLGDGLVPASDLFAAGVTLSLGSDGQTLTSILEEARRLETHERLRVQRRNLLVGPGGDVARTLLDAATLGGAQALDLRVGRIAAAHWADFVSYDLEDPSLAGWDDTSLLGCLLFSADSRALRDVFVGGRHVVQDGAHPLAERARVDFGDLVPRLFGR